MKLEKYFDQYCVNITAFGRKIGRSKTYLYELLKGKIPKVSDAKLIEEATEGKVTKEELLFPDEYQSTDGMPSSRQ